MSASLKEMFSLTQRNKIETTPEQDEAFRLLRNMTEDERLAVTQWFCSYCGTFRGTGDGCYCQDDL